MICDCGVRRHALASHASRRQGGDHGRTLLARTVTLPATCPSCRGTIDRGEEALVLVVRADDGIERVIIAHRVCPRVR